MMDKETDYLHSGIKKNKYGFHELMEKPSKAQIEEAFAEEYYQNCQDISYEKYYSDWELESFKISAVKKEKIINNHSISEDNSILDIGCGEGFLLNYFHQSGWNVCGIDYSDCGILRHNPDILPFLLKGDSSELLDKLISQNQKFSVVNMDLFLECCLEPEKVINQVKNVLLEPNGIFIIRVGNYYSKLHQYLLNEGIIQKETWFNRKANYYYFNKDGLTSFLETNGYDCMGYYGEFFIDFNLLNPAANYYEHPEIGRDCYQAAQIAEKLVGEASLDRMLCIEREMGEMGFGRHITGVFKKTI